MLPVLEFAAAVFTFALVCYEIFRYRSVIAQSGGTIVQSARQLGERVAVSAPPPTNTQSVWYAGLVAEPPDFAEQLVSLQASLHRANAPSVQQQQHAIEATAR